MFCSFASISFGAINTTNISSTEAPARQPDRKRQLQSSISSASSHYSNHHHHHQHHSPASFQIITTSLPNGGGGGCLLFLPLIWLLLSLSTLVAGNQNQIFLSPSLAITSATEYIEHNNSSSSSYEDPCSAVVVFLRNQKCVKSTAFSACTA